jgi:transcriptional antiterminator RfaH
MIWAVIQCKPGRERWVRFFLLKWLHLECYLPRIKHRKRTQALFPGYCFVQIENRWFDILRQPYVIRLLMNGERPARIPNEFIDNLYKRERNGFVKLPQPPKFRRGQPVKVIRGTFNGMAGIHDGMSGRDRERVLLELLGRKVRIELPTADVLAQEM